MTPAATTPRRTTALAVLAITLAIAFARDAGGAIADDEVSIDDGMGEPTGRGGAVGAWRDAFIPRGGGLAAGLGMVGGTFETAITWDRWPEFDAYVRQETTRALQEIFGGGTLNCRFTHVYTDGPAPYYTYAGAYRAGDSREQNRQLKQAASDAIMKAGGTITHHHAVGRQHRPWYDQERPDLFADVLRAAKQTLDPKAVLNPGVLIDP
jgi:alkyldihydroxyacetonephosphate synthase